MKTTTTDVSVVFGPYEDECVFALVAPGVVQIQACAFGSQDAASHPIAIRDVLAALHYLESVSPAATANSEIPF